jgi:hypothetical protein
MISKIESQQDRLDRDLSVTITNSSPLPSPQDSFNSTKHEEAQDDILEPFDLQTKRLSKTSVG